MFVAPLEIIDLLVWLFTFEDGVSKVLSSCKIFKGIMLVAWAYMSLRRRQRSLYFPVSLAVKLICSDEKATRWVTGPK